MKITSLLILVTCLQVSARTFSQQVSVSGQNLSLETVLEKVKMQTGLDVIYNPVILKGTHPVTLQEKNADLNKVLKKCFKGQPVNYLVLFNTIVVTPRPGQSQAKESTRLEGPPEMVLALLPVEGQVKSESGEPIVGASITIDGTSIGVTSDANGNFSLNAEAGAVLVFSHVGYEQKKIVLDGRTHITVLLTAKATGLDELVVVGYGTQKKATVTGSISSVKGEEISVAPVASVANSLAGRLPGLVSLQSSGQPGFDAASLSIRGFGNALVIVDGVESDFNSVSPNEIASVSILKDGAASIYGSRAGNGVILVTTKRGNNSKPVISLNSAYTLQGITTMPKPVSAGQYAELARESHLQSGQPEENAPYTEEQIQKFYGGTDPQFPNTNWYDVLIRDWAPMVQHSLSVRGGSDRIKYYGYLGYQDQKTIWKKSGGDYNRYNLRSNVDAKISDNFSLQLDLNSIVSARKYPPRLASISETKTAAWEDFWRTLPTYPATLPDPTMNSFAEGGGTGGAHITTNTDLAGYAKSLSQELKGTIALKYVSRAIDGLSAKALVNYLQNNITGKTFEKPYKYYTYDYAADQYTLAGGYNSSANMAIRDSKNRVITGQFSVNYDKRIAQDHHLKLLGLYEIIDYYSDFVFASRKDYLTTAIDQLYAGGLNGMANNGSASEMGRASYVGRLNYTYKNKYLLESSFRADASAKFPSEKRWGFFPSVSLGWRMSQEKFMDDFEDLDDLKLRVSYGSAGQDGVGNFQYLAGYQIASDPITGISYLFGNGGTQPALISTGLANPLLTWEKIAIYNAGVEFSMWNRKLYGSADVFYREEKGIPAVAITTLPGSFGAELPPENLNSISNRGFELELGTSGRLRDLTWTLSGNISWSRAKWMHFDEPVFTDLDQKRISQKSGRWTDEVYGYLSDGLFADQKEIDDLGFNQDNNLNAPNSSLRPGDIRYKNINGDSILNWKDETLIGKGTTPHWMFGFNANVRYRNFDLSALFQGAFGYYKDLDLSLGSVYTTVQYNERWTPENNNTGALLPRLGGQGAGFSDYRYKKAAYLRLKAFSLGYNVPEKWIQKAKLGQLRIYVAGVNLLTFDKLKKYGLDPEAPSGMSGSFYYPQQRTVSFGINVSF